jgi:hypothetical protein
MTCCFSGGQGRVEPPTFRFSGRKSSSGEVVQGRIRAQEKGIRPLPSGDSGARVSKSVSKLESGGASSQPPDIPSLHVRPVALQLQV